MPDIKQFLSRRYLRLVDNLSESFLLSPSVYTDWKTQRLLELMEQITTCIIYRESSLIRQVSKKQAGHQLVSKDAYRIQLNHNCQGYILERQCC